MPACGFDSIPADLLVHLSSRTLKNALGPQAQLGLSQTFYEIAGGVSGGSLATLLTGIEQVPPAVHSEAASDYALSRGTTSTDKDDMTIRIDPHVSQFKDILARHLFLQNACRSTSVPNTADSG